MATLTSTARSTLTTLSSSVDLVGALANTGANHARIWEAESTAKLEQRIKDVAVLAKAESATYKQEQALKLMQARKGIADSLKTEADRKLFNECLAELTV